MAYTFVKARGGKIGTSICEDDQLEVARAIEKKAADKGNEDAQREYAEIELSN
jgi:phosphoglycerate kinase